MTLPQTLHVISVLELSERNIVNIFLWIFKEPVSATSLKTQFWKARIMLYLSESLRAVDLAYSVPMRPPTPKTIKRTAEGN